MLAYVPISRCSGEASLTNVQVRIDWDAHHLRSRILFLVYLHDHSTQTNVQTTGEEGGKIDILQNKEIYTFVTAQKGSEKNSKVVKRLPKRFVPHAHAPSLRGSGGS